MAFPVVPITRSALLAGQPNGRLPDSLLVTIAGQDGGPDVRLVKPAALAWEAMCAAARAAGHVLKASGPFDSYRPYEVQEKIFRERYTTTPLAGRPSRVWNGRRWWQRPGTAAAAVPGTSNHGDAAAVDTGVERDGDPSAESIDQAALGWLLEHAKEFGWSWELQSEPWHLHYFAGDRLPDAVAAYHGPTATTPATPVVPHRGDLTMWHSPRRHDDFWVGADHHLHHAFYLDGVWSDDEDLGGVVAGDFVFGGWRPDIVDNKPRPQQLRVAVVGVDGYRHELVYQAAAGELLDERGGGGAWRPWARVGGQG